MNSAKIVEKMFTLSYDVLNDKLMNIIKSNLNIDNNMMLVLNLLHRKVSKIFSKTITVYQTIVPLIVMFPHPNHINVFPHYHFFEIIKLPQDTDSLHKIIEKEIMSLLTTVPDLSPQTIVILLFAIHIIQNVTRALLRFNKKTQPIGVETFHDLLLHFL